MGIIDTVIVYQIVEVSLTDSMFKWLKKRKEHDEAFFLSSSVAQPGKF
jgi:hypothetical protein